MIKTLDLAEYTCIHGGGIFKCMCKCYPAWCTDNNNVRHDNGEWFYSGSRCLTDKGCQETCSNAGWIGGSEPEKWRDCQWFESFTEQDL